MDNLQAMIKEVNKYIEQKGNIALDGSPLYSKKDNKYVFFFKYKGGSDNDYQECITFSNGKMEIKNLFTLLVEDNEKNISEKDYEKVTLANVR